MAGADEEKEKAAAVYAEKLGLAFQLIDDILDYEGDEVLLGKPVGSDQKNNKNTFVSLLGIEECRKIAETLTNEAVSALDAFKDTGDITAISEITDYLLSRKQ